MKPGNRRIARQKLPDGVASFGVDRESQESVPPFSTDERVSTSPIDLRPPSRVAAVARAILGAALVVGLSGSAAWGARHYVTTTPRFAVKDVVVSGNARRSVDEIAAEAGIVRGANVFSLDLERARNALLNDAWIHDATLSRRLPGTVSVQVIERDAAAIVALGDSYLASRDGEIFKRLEPGDPTDLPVVTGLTADSVAEDREGAVRSVRKALDLAAEYERSSMATRSPLQEVHVTEDGGFSLVVGKGGMSLVLGGPPFHRKLDQATRVIAEVEHRGAKPDSVLLDNEAHPERVVVRVR